MSDELDIPRINFDDMEQKRNFMRDVGMMKGIWKIEGKRVRRVRSDAQNAYYWAVVVHAFAKWNKDENQDDIGKQAAHVILAENFLSRDLVNKESGVVMGRVILSTTRLTTVEMSKYIEQCRDFIAENCHIAMPDPDPHWALTQKGDA